jgi:CTP synthase (UTP-ammonia lyase)
VEIAMSKTLRIALVGDFDPNVTAHRAIPLALQRSAQKLGIQVKPQWVHTSSIGPKAEEVADYAAVWCVPASPYANMAGALAAIRLARVSSRPFLGTCGGFQHAVLEYARNVLGSGQAEHEETAPDADMPVIARLTCSLVEKSGEIFFRDGSRLRTIYGADRAEEEYHCNYGLNPEYARFFAGENPLRICATDAAGEARAVELEGHRFFIATLFQPERSGLRGIEHPLVTAFLAAAS